jgi:hypothetical protein
VVLMILDNEILHDRLCQQISVIATEYRADPFFVGVHEDILSLCERCQYKSKVNHPLVAFRNRRMNHSPQEKILGATNGDIGIVPKNGNKFVVDVKITGNQIEALPVILHKHQARLKGEYLFIVMSLQGECHGFWSGQEPPIMELLIPTHTKFMSEQIEGIIEESKILFGLPEEKIKRHHECKGTGDPFFRFHISKCRDGLELLRERLSLSSS